MAEIFATATTSRGACSYALSIGCAATSALPYCPEVVVCYLERSLKNRGLPMLGVLEDQALERALCVSVLAWLCGADLGDFSGLRFEDGCNRPCGERLLAWGR
jgi:hypothetical protein